MRATVSIVFAQTNCKTPLARTIDQPKNLETFGATFTVNALNVLFNRVLFDI